MTTGMQRQKAAVLSGEWPLYRYDPRLTPQAKNPLTLDSKAPSIPFKDYAYMETRFKMLTLSHPEEAKHLLELAQKDAKARYRFYQQMAAMKYGEEADEA
jgi:pyruvate-ferredoxin/flavodoxin oxidoreductase